MVGRGDRPSLDGAVSSPRSWSRPVAASGCRPPALNKSTTTCGALLPRRSCDDDFGRDPGINRVLNAGTGEDRFALAILTGFFVARLFFAFTIGLGIDESYTVAISRRLCLSYFDHPPLHLWIAHFAALAAGENVIARIALCCALLCNGLDRLSIGEPAVQSPAGANRAFRPQCYAFLLCLRRKLDRSRWPAALRIGGCRRWRRPACSFKTAG